MAALQVSVLVLLATLAATVAAARGTPLVAFAVLAGSTVLLPATLLLPGSPTGVLTASRLVLVGVAVGALRAARRTSPGPQVLPLPVLLPLLAYLAVVAVTGVGLADPGVDPVPAAYAWVSQAEQAVVLVVALWLGRALPPRPVLLVLAAAAAAATAIALLESLTGLSWSRLLFAASPAQLTQVPAQALEVRLGHVRVRGAADFALAAGWLLVALVPAAAAAAASAAAARRQRWALLLLALVPLIGLAVYLTRSRTPLAALVVVVALAGAALLPRRPSLLVSAAAVAAMGLLLVGPALLAATAPDLDSGSVDVRRERLPRVLALVAGHPFRGTGLTGVSQIGLSGIDASYLLVYVEAGALALALLVIALAAATACVARGVLSAPDGDPDDHRLAVATSTGLLALVVAGVAFDVLTTLSTARLLWTLAGLGLAAAERQHGMLVLGPLRARLRPGRLLLAAAVVAVAALGAVAAPSRSAGEVVFATLDVRTEVIEGPPGLGRTLVTTACTAAAAASHGQVWALPECSEDGPPGWGRLRVEGADRDAVRQGLRVVATVVREQPGLGTLRLAQAAAGITSARPSWAHVAFPVAVLLAAAGLLLVPARRRWT